MKINEEKAYCGVCDDDVIFVTSEEIRTVTIREKTFEYKHKVARCNVCGERVFPVALGKINEITKYDTYKRIVGLLTSSEIIETRKNLGLSQVEFAKKLGCGEKTITRYENGAIQDKVIDNFIREIRQNETINSAVEWKVIFHHKSKLFQINLESLIQQNLPHNSEGFPWCLVLKDFDLIKYSNLIDKKDEEQPQFQKENVCIDNKLCIS